MATVAHAFSPKEFTCWIISDATNAGASGIHASNMHQLDVDSVSYPSLNLTQTLDVRSGDGRTFKDEDFFQDNNLRVVELSLSGTLHNDTGHNLLLQNICNDVSGDAAVASGHAGTSQKYGAAVTNAASSLTVVIKSSDHSNQRSLEFAGCVVTNFSVNADAGTEGGRYKWTATLQTGKTPDLNESSTACGNNVYANTTIPVLSNGSGIKVFNTDVVLNNFTCTIDHPAVFTGLTTTGYEVASRASECAVTVDTQVKYDGNTKGFVNSFDTQTAALSGDMFVIVNNNAYGIDVQNGVLTNVAYSEGDIMMLDCSIKSVDDGTDALVSFDITS
tara:strand:+ start:1119 stop:2114 length:996 start_codon:yes stop_codon:yes gene_type:complete